MSNQVFSNSLDKYPLSIDGDVNIYRMTNSVVTSSGTKLPLQYDTLVQDQIRGLSHDGGTFFVNEEAEGIYHFDIFIAWTQNATNFRELWLAKNADQTKRSFNLTNGNASRIGSNNTSGTVEIKVTDAIVIFVEQNGGDLEVLGSSVQSENFTNLVLTKIK